MHISSKFKFNPHPYYATQACLPRTEQRPEASGQGSGQAWAYNFDLLEARVPVDGDGPALMRQEDRRIAAFVRLVHRGSERPIWVVTSHLMTTSRDSKKLCFV